MIFLKLSFALVCTLQLLLLKGCIVHSMPYLRQAPSETNPIYGKYFEGDMRFPVGYDPRNGIVGERYRWPNNTVPYTISSDFAFHERQIIEGALGEISDKTCILFKERSTEPDYVHIERGQTNSGCWSFVGLQGGRQILNLQPPPGPHCILHGTIAHEMIHAIGFYHEQSRADRDDYITIVWDNIRPEQRSNFDKYSRFFVDPQGVPYDYQSLMHYNAYAFALDPSRPTILPKISNVSIGQNEGLSEGDVEKIRRLYHC